MGVAGRGAQGQRWGQKKGAQLAHYKYSWLEPQGASDHTGSVAV